MKPRILVIDDEAAIRDSLRMILEYEDYEFVGAGSGPDGIAQVKRDPPDMVVLDIKMPGTNGLETLAEIRKVDESLPVAMISGHGTITDAMQATRLGAFDFIEKPFTSERVLVTVQKGLELRSLRRENRELKLAMEARYEIVGDSPSLRSVLEAVQRAAPTNATVLLLGESGVGKELVARTIHRNSPRAGQRFIQVNCAAIPEELIESELFGHEKGSFTGATEKQIGKFEQADRGTIFLDEIGDMSARTQAKVLRVLQEQEVERLGSARTDQGGCARDCRDQQESRGGDPARRVSRRPLLPAERDSDPGAAAARAARGHPAARPALREAHERGAQPQAEALRPARDGSLQRYRWRGNIRELRNTIERLMIMSPGDVVRVEDLPAEIRGESSSRLASVAEPGASAPARPEPAGTTTPPAGTLREFKEAAERAFLVDKLRENNWNISKTAEALDTPRSNLYKKLEQYGIKQEIDG